jgi:hypothetical protein
VAERIGGGASDAVLTRALTGRTGSGLLSWVDDVSMSAANTSAISKDSQVKSSLVNLNLQYMNGTTQKYGVLASM